MISDPTETSILLRHLGEPLDPLRKLLNDRGTAALQDSIAAELRDLEIDHDGLEVVLKREG